MNSYGKYLELTAWTTGLLLLALMDPSTDVHYSICPFKFIGIPFCPGCGLGHSISYLFHGRLKASLHAHPLGAFAVMVIGFRIAKLFRLHIIPLLKKPAYGQQLQYR